MKKNIFPIGLLTGMLVLGNSLNTSARAPAKLPVADSAALVKSPNHSNVKGFKTDIQKSVTENKNFRKVLYTAKHLQLVLMSLKPGEEIGSEIHAKSDQFFRFEGGSGKCIIKSTTYMVKDGDVIIVPAGSRHNVINTDATRDLKLYTIYAVPQHQDGIIRATKKDADQHAAKFDGKTTE